MKSKDELLLIIPHSIKFKSNIELTQMEIKSSYEKILVEISKPQIENNQPVRRLSFFLPTIYKLVGSLPIKLSIGLFGYRNYNKKQQIIIANSTHVAKEVKMPDGTKVWLRSESLISYHKNFRSNRVVVLKGEALFEVMKDKKHPFKVKTNFGKITVFGTTFSVRSFDNEEFTRTLLKEGVVNFTDVKDKNGVILKPGEEATLNNGSGKMTVIQVDNIERKLMWRSHNFVFENEPLSQIVTEIAEEFKIKLLIADEKLAKERYTLQFNRNETLGKILEILSDVGKFRCRQQTDYFIIEK